jgi:pimeloyl-ACP methyl ester carboxylesterase
MTIRASAALLAAQLLLIAPSAMAQDGLGASRFEGRLDDGALWRAVVPDEWNGALLLWSRGWRPDRGQAEAAPSAAEAALLARGYALAGSSYSAGGWALAEAVPDQLATLDAFAAASGRTPERTLAWGMSMGGLVSVALAERHGDRIDGALPMCSSMGGALGMMNMGLDGAYALDVLLDLDESIRVVNIDDDMANGDAARTIADVARTSPEGLARLALVGVLAGLPGWTSPRSPEPADDDFAAQAQQMADLVPSGVLLPRAEQEDRAQGVFSWNDGVDYADLLERSGRRALVEALYAQAGLDLQADLERLNAAPRVAADPGAAAYMRDNYTPDARPRVPVLAVQRKGDGVTSPSLQRAYADAALERVGPDMIRSLWLDGAGHCNFSPEEILASVDALDRRVRDGRWPEPAAPFIAHEPVPMPRVCFRDGPCDGYPGGVEASEHD